MKKRAFMPTWWRLATLALLLFYFACETKESEATCAGDGDCTNIAQRCDTTTSTCVDIVCTTNNDCRKGWRCNASQKRCKDNTCQVDSDCETNERCKLSRCEIKPECEQDADCADPAKPKCRQNKCAVECEQDADCTDTTKPSCKNNRCFPPNTDCLADADCTDTNNPKCLRGSCKPTDGCENNDDCKDPQKPLCLAQICNPDTRPKEGEACDNQQKQCPDELVCHKETGGTDSVCRKKCLTYQPQCDGTKVCQQIQENEGACVDRNNGKQPGDLCDAAPCEKDLLCVDWKGKKVCSLPCDPNRARCGPGEECYETGEKSYTCVEERDPCGPGRPCATGYQCNNGRCDPPIPCERLKCADDEVCEVGRCRKKKCPNEVTCPPVYSCNSISGVCEPPPVDDPPCVACDAIGGCANPNATCLGGLGSTPDDRFCLERCDSGSCLDNKNFECVRINLTGGSCIGGACATGFTCDTTQNVCVQNNIPFCLPRIGTCRNKCKGITCTQPKQVCVPAIGSCLVPGGKNLCDTCTDAVECGTSSDLCLTYPNGLGSFCGQDCSSSTCPAGYQCFTVGSNRQCARVSINGTILSCPSTP
ncbi:MAG: hypothetical protein H6728_04185 [Myxococcales bacterium]|nr:hypothetical protein [Myxococcales bacterium]MCB9642250.1 hypothetical protein [Myxococcales bacterium]